MNFKKFISGVSAIAIAASAFAAMTVTASAKDYSGSLSIGASERENVYNWNTQGILTANEWTGSSWAGAWKNFSNLPNIAYASTVTVDFDFYFYDSTAAVIGIGDASKVGGMVSGTTYKAGSRAMYMGSTDGSAFGIRNMANNQGVPASNIKKVKAHAKITFDREAKKYTYLLTKQSDNTTLYSGEFTTVKSSDGTSTMDNLTWVDIYTNKSKGQIGFTSLVVSYTVPKTVQVLDKEGFTGAGDTEAAIAKVGIRAIDTIDSITIEANGEQKTKYQNEDYVFTTNFNGSEAVISILVNGVSDITSIDIN